MSKKLPRTSAHTLEDFRPAAKSLSDRPILPHAAGPLRQRPVRNRRHPAQGGPSGGPSMHPSQLPPAAPKPLPTIVEPGSGEKGHSAFRAAAGRLIIERHASLAAFAGLIPLPLVDMAAIAAIVDRMLRKLTRLHGRRLRPERSARLATAMIAGVAAPGIARLATTSLLGFVPGTELLGMAVGAISATLLVRVIGEAFLDRLSGVPVARKDAPAVGRG